jgi:hypothetical protein
VVIVTEDTYSEVSVGVTENGLLLCSETVFMDSAL